MNVSGGVDVVGSWWWWLQVVMMFHFCFCNRLLSRIPSGLFRWSCLTIDGGSASEFHRFEVSFFLVLIDFLAVAHMAALARCLATMELLVNRSIYWLVDRSADLPRYLSTVW